MKLCFSENEVNLKNNKVLLKIKIKNALRLFVLIVIILIFQNSPKTQAFNIKSSVKNLFSKAKNSVNSSINRSMSNGKQSSNTSWCWTRSMINAPNFVFNSLLGGLNWGFCGDIKSENKVVYSVEVFTGRSPDSGTDSSLKLRIFGDQGATSDLLLTTRGFEASSIKTVEVQSIDVGNINKIRLKLDGNQGYFFRKIIVTKNSQITVFDNISRLEPCNGYIQPNSCRVELYAEGNFSYYVSISTSNEKRSGTDVPIFFKVYGAKSRSPLKLLNDYPCEDGSTESVRINSPDLGEITGYFLKLGGIGQWKPVSMVVKNMFSGITKTFNFGDVTLKFPGSDSLELSIEGVNPSTINSVLSTSINIFPSVDLNLDMDIGLNASLSADIDLGLGDVAKNLQKSWSDLGKYLDPSSIIGGKLPSLPQIPSLPGLPNINIPNFKIPSIAVGNNMSLNFNPNFNANLNMQLGAFLSETELYSKITFSCDQTFENIDGKLGPMFPTYKVNYFHLIGYCPGTCHRNSGYVYGVGIHPEESPICYSGIIDKAISPYGGVFQISVFSGLAKYQLPSNIRTKVAKIEIKGFPYRSKRSFVLSKIDNVDLVEKDLRILDHEGRFSNSGRLELRVEGDWGTVCYRGMNRYSAVRICKDLGFKFGEWKNDSEGSKYCRSYNGEDYCGADGLNILMQKITCSENDSDFNKCSKMIAEDCSHDDDSIINCTNEDFESDSNIPFGNLRLVGTSVLEGFIVGRLEMFNKQDYFPICNTRFNSVSATIACRQMGYKLGKTITGAAAEAFKLDEDSIVGFAAGNVGCRGYERLLKQCSLDKKNISCKHSQDVVIGCVGNGDPTGENQYKAVVRNSAPDLGKLTVPKVFASCNTNGDDRMFRGDPGSIYLVVCDSGCASKPGLVWGTGIFTGDSRVCKAGVHSGAINNTGFSMLLFTKTFGQDYYEMSDQRDVESSTYNKLITFSFSVSRPNGSALKLSTLLDIGVGKLIDLKKKTLDKIGSFLKNKANSVKNFLFGSNFGTKDILSSHGPVLTSVDPDLLTKFSFLETSSMLELENYNMNTLESSAYSEGIFGAINKGLGAVAKTVNNVNKAANSAANAANSAVNSAKNAVNKTVDSANKAVNNASKSINKAINDVNAGINSTVNSVNKGINNAVGAVNKGISDVSNKVNSAVKDAANAVNNTMDKINNFKQGIEDKMNKGINSLKDSIGSSINSIGSGFNSLKDAAGNMKNNMSKYLCNKKDIPSPVWDWTEPNSNHRFGNTDKVVVSKNCLVPLTQEYSLLIAFTLEEFYLKPQYIFSIKGCGGFNVFISADNTLIIGDPCKVKIDTNFAIPLNSRIILQLNYRSKVLSVNLRVMNEPTPKYLKFNVELPMIVNDNITIGSVGSLNGNNFFGRIEFALVFKDKVSKEKVDDIIEDLDTASKVNNTNWFSKTQDGRNCVSPCITAPVPGQKASPLPPFAADLYQGDTNFKNIGSKSTNQGGHYGDENNKYIDSSNDSSNICAGDLGVSFLEQNSITDNSNTQDSIDMSLEDLDQNLNTNTDSNSAFTNPTLFIDCNTTMESNKDFTGPYGKRFRIKCPACKNKNYPVFGSYIYHPASSICKAAEHTGVLNGVDPKNIYIIMTGGKQAFNGSESYDVTSGSLGGSETSFKIEEAAPLTQITCDTTGNSGVFQDLPLYKKVVVVCPEFCLSTHVSTTSSGLNSSNSSNYNNINANTEVFGTRIYADISPVCLAAIHDGNISDKGGEIQMLVEDGQDYYQGSDFFGVTSLNYGPHIRSFSFLGHKTAEFFLFKEDNYLRGKRLGEIWEIQTNPYSVDRGSNFWEYKKLRLKSSNNDLNFFDGIYHSGKIKLSSGGSTTPSDLPSFLVIREADFVNGKININIVKINSSKAGFYFRYQDEFNYYAVIFTDLSVSLMAVKNANSKILSTFPTKLPQNDFIRIEAFLNFNKIDIFMQLGVIMASKHIFNISVAKEDSIPRGNFAVGCEGEVFFEGIEINKWTPESRNEFGLKQKNRELNRRSWDKLLNKAKNEKYMRKFCKKLYSDEQDYLRCQEPHLFCQSQCLLQFKLKTENIHWYGCFKDCVKVVLLRDSYSSISSIDPNEINPKATEIINNMLLASMGSANWVPEIGELIDYRPATDSLYRMSIIDKITKENYKTLLIIRFLDETGAETTTQEEFPNSRIKKCGFELKTRMDCKEIQNINLPNND